MSRVVSCPLIPKKSPIEFDLLLLFLVIPSTVVGTICGSSSDSAPSEDEISFGSGKFSPSYTVLISTGTVTGTIGVTGTGSIGEKSPSGTCKVPCEISRKYWEWRVFFDYQPPPQVTTVLMQTGMQVHHDQGNFHIQRKEVSVKRTLEMGNPHGRSQWRINHHIPHQTGVLQSLLTC